jgi:exodeoxyribonuclease-1
VARIPLKTVHINKCPVLAPMSVLRAEDAKRLGIDVDACLKNGELLAKSFSPFFTNKISAVFNSPYENSQTPVDVDLALYSGSFFSAIDKKAMVQIRNTSPEKLAMLSFHYDDLRLPEMLFRYRARNYPNTLTTVEWETWRAFCVEKLNNDTNISLNDYLQRVQALQNQGKNVELLKSLLDYTTEKKLQLGLNLLPVK